MEMKHMLSTGCMTRFKQTSLLFFKIGRIYKHKISINGD